MFLISQYCDIREEIDRKFLTKLFILLQYFDSSSLGRFLRNGALAPNCDMRLLLSLCLSIRRSRDV